MSASPKLPMSPEQADAIDMMKDTTFTVASWDKRFFAHLLECRQCGMIGEKAIPQLWRMFNKYRRQHRAGNPQRRAELLCIADKLAAPDFRKQQAVLADHAKIDALKVQYQKAMTP